MQGPHIVAQRTLVPTSDGPGTLSIRRKIVISLTVVCCLAATAWLAMVIPFFLVMRERERHVETILMRFAELHADFLYNGFGTYILEFRSYSELRDGNIDCLMLLNELPLKDDLALLIETEYDTDASIAPADREKHSPRRTILNCCPPVQLPSVYR